MDKPLIGRCPTCWHCLTVLDSTASGADCPTCGNWMPTVDVLAFASSWLRADSRQIDEALKDDRPVYLALPETDKVH